MSRVMSAIARFVLFVALFIHETSARYAIRCRHALRSRGDKASSVSARDAREPR